MTDTIETAATDGESQAMRTITPPDDVLALAMVAASRAGIEFEEPSGKPSWPFVVIEGGEKVGKSWKLAELSGSPRVGLSFWLDLDEGVGHEYGAVPGARYKMVKHDGTWSKIMEQILKIYMYAQGELDAGRPPVVLLIDSGSAEWELQCAWADNMARARAARNGKVVGIGDPIDISMDLWNAATDRHYQLINLLKKFPGIVVMTARGGEVSEVKNGKPTGKTVYKVDGHKRLIADCSLWIRLEHGNNGTVMGARSVHNGVRFFVDRGTPIDEKDWTLDWLLFDALGLAELAPETRRHTVLQPGDELPDSERFLELRKGITMCRSLRELTNEWWPLVRPALEAGHITRPEADMLKNLTGAKHEMLSGPPEDVQGEPADGDTGFDGQGVNPVSGK